jgi:hypothetical protein
MSIHRYNARTDTSQKPIVKALRDAGVRVWHIGRPCDLLLRFWCERHHDHCWQTLEVKTPVTKAGDPRRRKDQQTQDTFLAETDTPRATDFDSAWRELNKRHSLGRVQTACVLKSA